MRNWRKIIPNNRGGSRPPGPPKCTVYANGVVVLNSSLLEMLGEPAIIQPFISDDTKEIKLVPNDKSGYALSGGGGTMARFTMKSEVSKSEWLIGTYVPGPADYLDDGDGVILAKEGPIESQ